MRGFKWSSNQKRHLTAIVACPHQQSMSNKPWMIKKINWRALSDTDHVCQGGSYVTLTPCLLIVGDLPWNKVLCGSASIETITPMKESRVNISWCISFSDFQNRIQKKRISRKNVNRVFFLKKMDYQDFEYQCEKNKLRKILHWVWQSHTTARGTARWWKCRSFLPKPTF